MLQLDQLDILSEPKLGSNLGLVSRVFQVPKGSTKANLQSLPALLIYRRFISALAAE
jgi:hypothetical protein